MKTYVYLMVLLFVIGLVQSCCNDSPLVSENQNNVFYFNSFESDSDTTGWIGLSKNMLVSESCPSDGKRALHIGGGCVQPAASIELYPVPEGNYTISFWGKMGQQNQGAQIKLKISGSSNDDGSLVVNVGSTDWNFYQSATSLHVPAHQKLTMEIWAGGIVPADVYLDNLKVEKTESGSLAWNIYKDVLDTFR